MSRIRELDGLRFFAILGVLMVHFRPSSAHRLDFMSLGWAGVDLFFVISGFLITNILIRLRAEKHPFKTFYWRRLLRIFPPYYAALAIVLLLALMHREVIPKLDAFESATFLSSLDMGSSFATIWARISGHAGFAVAALPVAEPGFRLFTNGMGVFWSLSVEEAFYLLWAPVILRGSRRTILLFSVLPLMLCPALRALLHTSAYHEMFSFFCRFDSLAAGGCVALTFAAAEKHKYSSRALDTILALTVAASSPALLWLIWRCGFFRGVEVRTTLAFSIFGYTLLAILFAAITGSCARWSAGRWIAPLRIKFLTYVGTISYTVYLIHIPVYVATGLIVRRFASPNTWAQAALAIIGAISIAAFSWKYFEAPILRLRDRPVAAQVSAGTSE
jgi:peptidoglycan/LPS O-acetylase OafA/YrhL